MNGEACICVIMYESVCKHACINACMYMWMSVFADLCMCVFAREYGYIMKNYKSSQETLGGYKGDGKTRKIPPMLEAKALLFCITGCCFPLDITHSKRKRIFPKGGRYLP